MFRPVIQKTRTLVLMASVNILLIFWVFNSTLIEKYSDDLTKIIVSEHGKVYEDAKGSLTRGLEVVEFACGIPQLLKW